MRRGGVLPRPITGALLVPSRSPAGGEIAEAPPVAEEASRFRGSAPVGGHDSGRESVGTTVGKRAPPLRTARYASVGADDPVRTPPYARLENRCHRADVGIGPYKVMPCRAGPMCPAVSPYPLQKARHCHDQRERWSWQSVLLAPGRPQGSPLRSPFPLYRKAVSPCHENSPSLSWPFSALLPWQRVCAFPAPGR